MANETIYGTKGYLDIVRKGKVTDDMIEQYQLNGTAVVGNGMTSDGETYPDIDVMEDGDGAFVGIQRKPSVRPSNTYDIGDTIADDTTVDILKPTGGRLKVAVQITGVTGGDTAKRGDLVCVPDFTATGIASAYPTPGAFMVVPADVDTSNISLRVVGTLAEDITIGDSASAEAAVVALINY